MTDQSRAWQGNHPSYQRQIAACMDAADLIRKEARHARDRSAVAVIEARVAALEAAAGTIKGLAEVNNWTSPWDQ